MMVRGGWLCILLLQQATSIDIDGVAVMDRVEVVGGHVSLPCTGVQHYTLNRLEWRCRGCFSISPTRETLVAQLINSKSESLVFPDRMGIIKGSSGFSLDIKPTQTQDSGLYFCVINKETKPGIVYNIAVQDVPSTPGKPLIMAFNSSSVNLTWAPPLQTHFAPLTHYKLEILEGEVDTWTNYVTINTGSPESSFSVKSLKPFTVYSFRVIGVNRIGMSAPSLPSYHIMTLREPPRGKPTITNSINLSCSSVRVLWRPPPAETIHGEFLGYRISWKVRNSKNETQSVTIKEPDIREYSIKNLHPFTQYLVSIQVVNPKGEGPPATVVVMTDEGVPGSPRNLSVVSISNHGCVLQWSRPEVPNGRISGYRLFWASERFTNVKTVNSSDEVVSADINGLDPYMKYKVFVKAFNSNNEGNSSDSIQVMSDVSGPSLPVLTNLTCPDDRSVYLEWSKPEKFFHSVDKYVVFYKRKDEVVWGEREIRVPPVVTSPPERIVISNLTVGGEYSVYIQGYTQSLYIETLQYPGNVSETLHIVAGRDCNRVQVSPMREDVLPETTRLSIAILLGTTAVFLVLILAVLGLAIWRRNLMHKRFYIPAAPSKDNDSIMWDIQVDEVDSKKTSVPASLFSEHVELMHADGDLAAHAEFVNIKQAAAGKLDSLPARSKQSSINIQPIHTFQARGFYLYLGEPWEVEPVEFWWLVHKSEVKVVVAVDAELDTLVPREPETLGSLDVVPVMHRTHPSFTITKINLRLKRGRRGSVDQAVFILRFSGQRPGVRTELDFLRFVRVCANLRKNSAKPLVLGGRSLAYMAVDTLMVQLESTNEINVPAYIRYLGSVTRLEQLGFRDFIFIYDTLLQAVKSKGSNLSTSSITETIPDQFIEKQFSVCTEVDSTILKYNAALCPLNQGRNTSLEYVAVDWSRVVLNPPPDNSDYINASWVPGYSGCDEFILCQHPGGTTVHHFWQMIWQAGSKIILCLSVIPHQFWPTLQAPIIAPGLRVWLSGEGEVGGYRSAELVLERAGASATVQLVLCPNWPHQSVPVSNCVHLVDCVNKQLSAAASGPLVVVDSYGATEAGIFIVLSSLVRQMDIEEAVDVSYWFKAVHLSRPGVWISPDNLGFVYRVLAELCSINSQRR